MIEVLRGQLEHVHTAGASRFRYYGAARFVGTDTTGEIPVPDIKKASNVQVTKVGNAAPEGVSVDEAMGDDGYIDVPAEGVTIDRTAGTTADLSFFFQIDG